MAWAFRDEGRAAYAKRCLRKKGLLTDSKKGNVIRYTQQDIDNYKLSKMS